MKRFILLLSIPLALAACKTAEKTTASEDEDKMNRVEPSKPKKLRPIIVDASRGVEAKIDFTMDSWSLNRGALEVVVQYSGGCDEHIFNAYFSGAWLKSRPPQALIEIEHLDPKNDPCRSMGKDTLRFDASVLEYDGSEDVWIKWANDPGMMARYQYGKEDGNNKKKKPRK